MCANKGGPLKPDQVNVQLSVVPSSLNFARKVPWAPLAFGGTSLKVDSRVEKRRASPSLLLFACVEKLPNTRTAMAASAALMHSFFIFLLLSRHQEHAGLGERGVLPSRRLKD